MKRRILVIIFIMILLVNSISNKSLSLDNIKSISPQISSLVQPFPPNIIELVPIMPKFKKIDWHANLASLVQQMSLIKEINNSSTLFINTIKNDTNGNVDIYHITDILIRLIITKADEKFNVVSSDQVIAAHKILGLVIEDSLTSRSKAVGLARYLNAQYVLYSVIIGDVKHPMFEMQLILVQSGEIIWSRKIIIS